MTLPPLSQEVSASRYAYFGEPARAATGLRVLLAGREKCLPTYHVSRQGFKGYGVEYVSEGVGQVTLDGRTFPLFPGVLFCYGPRTPHDIASDPRRPLTKYFADLSGRDALPLLRRNGLLPGAAVQIPNIEPPRALFELLLDGNETDSGAAMENAESCLRLILLRARQAHPPVRPAAPATNFSHWLAYLEETYLRLRNLEQMAGELHTRPNQICRVFRQFGQPRPFHLLTRKKLNRAVELLVGERLSVQAAAAAVGYDDPYHFSRLFKHHFGRSPVHFLRLAGRLDSD